jgi:TolB-like protein/Tfp pilus assembly protein PilF
VTVHQIEMKGLTWNSHFDEMARTCPRAAKLLSPMLPLERRASTVKRFGTFEVDLRARELRKGGIRIRLQDQPFEILEVMLDRPGEVVTREELRQRLWPDGTFVDFEHSLNAAIKRLRSALGDDADNPRFVETLHRRGYRFIADVDSEGRAVRNLQVLRPQVSKPAESMSVRLVVLPFANLSNDPAQEYFSDGLTEEMITQIGRLCPGRLGVIARTSSMLFKRSAKSASEIGRELSADYLLEGSVRGDGDRVRITAQLIETRTEVHLWAETYDRSVGETLNLQTDVAAHIARSLAIELVPDQADVLGRATPRRTEAYQAYLKGRYHWNRGSLEGVRSAISYYEQALTLEPDFAAAHSAMARARIALANNAAQPGRAFLEQARVSALRSIEIDPGISDAHLALAEIRRTLEWNWRTAEDEYRTAIALSPSCESAHRFYAHFLAAMSRFGEAKAEADRACDVDPFCLVVSTNAAWVRYAAGEIGSAINRSRGVLDMDSGFMPARRLLGIALLAAGKSDEAVVELTAAAGPDGDRIALAWLAHARAVAGARDEAAAIVARLEAESGGLYVPYYHLALAHVGLGNRDSVFRLLDRACADREPAVINLKVEPRFDPLRRDPRYGSLLQRLGLQQS